MEHCQRRLIHMAGSVADQHVGGVGGDIRRDRLRPWPPVRLGEERPHVQVRETLASLNVLGLAVGQPDGDHSGCHVVASVVRVADRHRNVRVRVRVGRVQRHAELSVLERERPRSIRLHRYEPAIEVRIRHESLPNHVPLAAGWRRACGRRRELHREHQLVDAGPEVGLGDVKLPDVHAWIRRRLLCRVVVRAVGVRVVDDPDTRKHARSRGDAGPRIEALAIGPFTLRIDSRDPIEVVARRRRERRIRVAGLIDRRDEVERST